MSSDPLPFIFRQGHTHTHYHIHKHTPYMHKYTEVVTGGGAENLLENAFANFSFIFCMQIFIYKYNAYILKKR